MATLVARNARPGIVFETVCAEVGRLLPADGVGLGRYEPDGTVSSLGMWTNTDGFVPGGTRVQFDGRTGAGQVFETRRPVRINSFVGVPGPLAAMARAQGWQSSVTAPIFVEDGLWGAVGVASMSDKPLPPDTERRLGQFSELMATAIANAESRAQLAASRARIVATADATRRRIERDLHDGAQQHLVTLALELRAAQEAEAIGGALRLHSPRGGGTSLVVELPLDTDRE